MRCATMTFLRPAGPENSVPFGKRPGLSMGRLWSSYLFLVAMNGIDWLYTHAQLESPTGVHEANPIMRAVWEHSGMLGIAGFKIAVLLMLGLLINQMVGKKIRWLYYKAVLVYAALTCWHVFWWQQGI